VSAWLVSKIDIDILVSLALYGPVEATEPWWPFHEKHGPTGTEPPVEVSTALGGMLWRANADRALDPQEDDPLPEYTFERVRFPVTAVEGLKLVGCFGYQTAGDGWPGSEPARFCQWLQGMLIPLLPGYAEAPWGWQASDVDVRLDQLRAAGVSTGLDEPAPVPPDASRVLQVLRANRVEVEPAIGDDEEIPPSVARDFQAEPSRQIGHWLSGNYLNRRQVQVRLFADEAAAHAGYLARRALQEQVREWPFDQWLCRVQRHGRLVIELARPAAERARPVISDMHLTTRAEQETAFAQLGEPDQAWSTDNLPILAEGDGGRVLATCVALPPGYGSAGVDVGADDTGLHRIAALVDDEDARQQILAVDVDRQYVLMIVGVCRVDGVTSTRMVELASPAGQAPRYRWEMTIDGLRRTPAVVIAVDKPPQWPTEAVVHHPGAGRTPTTLAIYHH
jgi:hypothetical protein